MSEFDLGYVLGAGAALEEWNFGGDILRLLVSAERSHGAVSVIEGIAHGGGPPLHVHDAEDEVVVVVEGRLAYQIGERRGEVEPGGVLWMPRQIPHTVANLSELTCRFLTVAVPGGIEIRFRAQSQYLSTLPAGVRRIRRSWPISRAPRFDASSARHCKHPSKEVRIDRR